MYIFMYIYFIVTISSPFQEQVQREEVAGRNGGFVALRCGFSEVDWFKQDSESGDLIAVEELQ